MKKKLLFLLSLLLPGAATVDTSAAVPAYDAQAALAGARNDVANWMSYLPDDVYVAHVSIPGTHDTATAEGWKSSTGPTYSTTQEKTIDEQLAGGIRAFDFRPGMVSGVLYCNHGTDQTTLTLAAAFTKLKNYLDAHPGEFFVMHLFRGNIYRSGEASTGNKFLGAKDDAASQAQYNELFNQLFNTGEFADYFVDYSPYLKVGDVRGKIIVFRRDRIDFAHINKAGNLANWPADNAQWSPDNVVSVTNASDPTVKGIIWATDVSSPDNETELNIELSSMDDLFNANCAQTRPNDAKRAGSYKPTWSMIFTSGAYGGENTNGYRKNATYTNPHFTELVKNATKHGPTGIVFSDWVLTDNNSGYETKGIDLVPAIYENNFSYIEEFLLDDELFSQTEAESYWEEGKQYFMRNVGATQEKGSDIFLSAGLWWGTHATADKYGLRVTPVFDKNNGTYTLTTNITNTAGIVAGIGPDDYADNAGPQECQAVHVGNGRFVFHPTSNNSNALIATTVSGFYDQTPYNVYWGAAYDEGNLYQQWELVDIEEYYNDAIASASKQNGVDISYMIGRTRKNDNESNATWTITNGKSATTGLQGTSDNVKFILGFKNAKKGSFAIGWDAKWSVSKNITNIPNGVYTLSWNAVADNITDETITVNGINVKSQIKSIGTSGTTSIDNIVNAMNTGDYRCSVDLIVTNNTIEIKASAPTHSSATAFYLDDFVLVYYGPDPVAACNLLQKAINDATAKLPAALSEGWSEAMAPYQAMVNNQTIVGDGTNEAYEVYQLLRERIYTQNETGADYSAAIINNSFEWGDAFGWDVTKSDDTGVYPNSNGVYHTENCDGNYLFNTWAKGTPVTQTIYALPAGRYRLEALAVTGDTDETRYVYLLANGEHSDAIEVSHDKVNMTNVAFEFEVAETSNVTIGIVGAKTDGAFDPTGEQWYKADNFRLYLVEPMTTIEWTMEGATYDTLVLPFDAEIPEGIEIYTPQSFDYDAKHNFHIIVLQQETEMIAAHTPYIVKRAAAEEAPAMMRAAARVATRVDENTYTFTGYPTEGTPETENLTGTHTDLDVETGHYAMVHNQDVSYFQVVDGPCTVKAAHAYIPATALANQSKALYIEEVPDTEVNLPTGVESVAITDDTLVDVYTVSGVMVRSQVRVADALTDLANGLYILRSATTSAKVAKLN